MWEVNQPKSTFKDHLIDVRNAIQMKSLISKKIHGPEYNDTEVIMNTEHFKLSGTILPTNTSQLYQKLLFYSNQKPIHISINLMRSKYSGIDKPSMLKLLMGYIPNTSDNHFFIDQILQYFSTSIRIIDNSYDICLRIKNYTLLPIHIILTSEMQLYPIYSELIIQKNTSTNCMMIISIRNKDGTNLQFQTLSFNHYQTLYKILSNSLVELIWIQFMKKSFCEKKLKRHYIENVLKRYETLLPPQHYLMILLKRILISLTVVKSLINRIKSTYFDSSPAFHSHQNSCKMKYKDHHPYNNHHSNHNNHDNMNDLSCSNYLGEVRGVLLGIERTGDDKVLYYAFIVVLLLKKSS